MSHSAHTDRSANEQVPQSMSEGKQAASQALSTGSKVDSQLIPSVIVLHTTKAPGQMVIDPKDSKSEVTARMGVALLKLLKSSAAKEGEWFDLPVAKLASQLNQQLLIPEHRGSENLMKMESLCFCGRKAGDRYVILVKEIRVEGGGTIDLANYVNPQPQKSISASETITNLQAVTDTKVDPSLNSPSGVDLSKLSKKEKDALAQKRYEEAKAELKKLQAQNSPGAAATNILKDFHKRR